MPNHEPRGCPRGASASWYLYHSGRIKYPMIRRPLLELWREARKTSSPVEAWKQYEHAVDAPVELTANQDADSRLDSLEFQDQNGARTMLNFFD